MSQRERGRKAADVPEDGGVLSSIERHPAWGDLCVVLGVKPGDNNVLQQEIRALGRAEAEQARIGTGPDVRAAHTRAEARARGTNAEVERFARAGIAIPPDLAARHREALEQETAAAAVLADRKRRLTEAVMVVTAAHAAAVAAIESAVANRLAALGRQAQAAFDGGPDLGKRHPVYLADGVLRAVQEAGRVIGVAGRFVGTGDKPFVGELSKEARAMIAARVQMVHRAPDAAVA